METRSHHDAHVTHALSLVFHIVNSGQVLL